MIELNSGETVKTSGYYIYKGSPNYGEIPQYPDKKDRVLVLNKGDIIPQVESHDAIYRLVTEKHD